jgi:RimJ/RimL family protein N-acetyltransferase
MHSTTSPIRLAGHEISLRPWHILDFPAFAEIQNSTEQGKYQLWPVRPDQEPLDVFKSRIEQSKLVSTGDYMSLAIVHQSVVVGEVGLYIRSRAHAQVEISWNLLSEHRGRGYAQEAGRLLIDYAFEALQVQKVVAEIDKRNVASLRLGLLLGFDIEGIHRSHRFVKQQWVDVYLLGLIRTNWKGRA